MEDLLELYAEPYEPARPVVCLDEHPVALGERRTAHEVAQSIHYLVDEDYAR